MRLRLFLTIFADALLAVAAYCSALALSAGDAVIAGALSLEQLRPAAIFVAITLFSSYLMEVYSVGALPNRRALFVNCLEAGGTSFFFLSVAYYLMPEAMMGRVVLVLAIAFFFLFQFLWHTLLLDCLRGKQFSHKVLMLGTGKLARQIGELVVEGDSPFTLVGYVSCDYDPAATDGIPPDLLVPKKGDLAATARGVEADVIAVALTERRGVLPLQEMIQCKLEGIQVVDAPTLYEMVHEKLLLEEITPSWIIFSAGFHRTVLISTCKRFIDLVLALAVLALTVPLLPLVTLAIKLDSPGPLFFKQVRVGRGGRPFLLYKLRSMTRDAERNGPVWAAKNDNRVTRVGRILRNSRIDELPQFYNVLRGEMSVIGPRPERPEFVESLKKEISYYSKRHAMKPGITGWAQVRYPYGATTYDALEKLRYDLYYIKNHSPFLDTQIILETVRVVLFGRGGR